MLTGLLLFVTALQAASPVVQGSRPNPKVYAPLPAKKPPKPVEFGVKDAFDPLTLIIFLGEEVNRTRRQRKGKGNPFARAWEHGPVASCAPGSFPVAIAGVCRNGTFVGPLFAGVGLAARSARDTWTIAQASLALNLTGGNFYGGIQATLLVNRVGGNFLGVGQLSLFNDIYGSFFGGAQVGFVNRAGNFFGVAQAGAVNTAGIGTGLQLGLANSADLWLGLQLGVLLNDGGDFGGISISPLNFHENGWGLKIGVLTSNRARFGGILIGGMNFGGHAMGIIVGVGNSMKYTSGVALGVVNITEHDMSGMQVGLINTADHARGVQIGLINFAEKLTGVQIGLINTALKGGLPFMVGLNIGFY